jgi:hypothetical protein
MANFMNLQMPPFKAAKRALASHGLFYDFSKVLLLFFSHHHEDPEHGP